jgi:hypothetical protein
VPLYLNVEDGQQHLLNLLPNIFCLKKVFILSAVFGLILFSCNKSGSDRIASSLDGNWRMVIVKDIASGVESTKPSSVQGEVEITITSTNATRGTFKGKTPSNEIESAKFSLGANQSLSVSELSMTKVNETN